MLQEEQKQKSKKIKENSNYFLIFLSFCFDFFKSLKNVFKRNSQQPNGFTLIELIVGMGIFVLVVLTVMGIFQQVIYAQRRAIGTQNIQDNLRYFMEVTTKEIRTAKRNFGTCADVPLGQIYEVNNNTLYFQNQYDECVAYFLDDTRLKIARNGTELFVTPDEIIVPYLFFYHKDSAQDAIVMLIAVSVLDFFPTGSNIIIQNTISSRYYLEGEIL